MQSHSLHDADQTAGLADAYVSQPTNRAACPYQLSNFDSQQFLHWHHSIQTEYNYLNPFDAVMSAWKLGWSVFCDAFEGSIMPIQPPTAGAVHDKKGRPDHAFAVLEDSSPLRSCIRKSRDTSAVHLKKVQFHDRTSIHMGLEDELSMQCTDMNTFELATWSEKPWVKKPSKGCPAGDIARPERNRSQQSKRPRISEVRLTDEHANVPRRIAAASTAPPDAPLNQLHLPPPPAFVTDIFGLPGFLALPHDFLMENTFLIRTWYVHHYHFPRWAVPRFVELDHRWVLWQQEIARSWRDMIQPNEDVQFFTVLPDPDRSFLQRQAVADVLVVQGTDAERYAGLLTVHHQTAQGSLRPFAVAISLPDEVSGLGLAAAADITHLCNTHTPMQFLFRLAIDSVFHPWMDMDLLHISHLISTKERLTLHPLTRVLLANLCNRTRMAASRLLALAADLVTKGTMITTLMMKLSASLTHHCLNQPPSSSNGKEFKCIDLDARWSTVSSAGERTMPFCMKS